MSNQVEEYNEDDDLGLVIDDRLQFGKTAGKIMLLQTTFDVLIKLLIDKGVFTSEEFVEVLKAKEAHLDETTNSAKAEKPNASAQELKDLERYLEAFTKGLNVIYKKLT